MSGVESVTDVKSPIGTPLTVDADLRLRLGDTDVLVKGYGNTVVVQAPSLRAARQLRRAASQWPVRRLLDALAFSGVALDVRVGDVSVGGFDRDHSGGVLSRVVGTGPVSVYPEGVVLAALRRGKAA
ncbi:hypothetical protein [Haloarchaeobius sp. HME9146]|uniref:hypothetical protein n=1 Tax=Haloarchaeobius sp. HME9146 TaxID=2978732 RepID=UPI0021BEFB38|nr:hypothetical protein [Haloarchaeobius sp. HME9146]MCT9095913.1 hypothetical protein [Haloarchaeobius sp. HME9146]